MSEAVTVKRAADSIRDIAKSCASKLIPESFLAATMRSGAVVAASEIELRLLALSSEKKSFQLGDVLLILDDQKKALDALKVEVE